MVILGIDPSLNSCGLAVISYDFHKSSVLHLQTIVQKSDDLNVKIMSIYRVIQKITSDYNLDLVGIEDAFVNINPQSSLKLGMVRGACICAIGDKKLINLDPKTIKKTITGSGNADKNQVQYMLKYLINECDVKNFDESDAIAVAISCGIISRYK